MKGDVMDKVMGTCSKCGGRVVLPEAWMGVKTPVLRCDNCGATKKQPYGPVIDMEGGKVVDDYGKR